MRVVITGAAGFLGSHLAERFLSEGYDVLGVDNYITGVQENIRLLKEHERFRFRYHDISRPLFLDGEVDGVLHGGVRKGQRLRLAYPARARVAGEPVYDLEQQGIWFLRRSAKRGEYLADHPNRYQSLNNLDQIRRIVSAMKTESGNGSSNRNQKKKK